MQTPSLSASVITWLGHSTVSIQMNGIQILTDPVLRRRVVHLRRRGELATDAWLNGVDAVLISHLHHDHCDLPTLRRLSPNVPIIVPAGACGWLRRQGLVHVVELPLGSTSIIGDVSIAAVQASHPGRRLFGPAVDPIGFVVSGTQQVYFAGDTDLFPEMAAIHASLDCALLPVWGWGRTLGAGHMDPGQAAEALRLLRPRIAIPIHWGTYHPYGTGLRDRRFLVEPPLQFKRAAARLAPEVDVRVLTTGERLVIA